MCSDRAMAAVFSSGRGKVGIIAGFSAGVAHRSMVSTGGWLMFASRLAQQSRKDKCTFPNVMELYPIPAYPWKPLKARIPYERKNAKPQSIRFLKEANKLPNSFEAEENNEAEPFCGNGKTCRSSPRAVWTPTQLKI